MATFDRISQQEDSRSLQLDTSASETQRLEEEVLLTGSEGPAQLRSRRPIVFAALFVGVLACVGLVASRSSAPRDDTDGVVQLNGAVYQKMHAARAEMQENMNTLHKKFESFKPERLHNMKQRFNKARTNLQDNVAALRDSETDAKLAQVEPGKAVVLSAMRDDLKKGLWTLRSAPQSTRGPSSRARGFSKQQRRQLHEVADKMQTGVGALKGKIDKFKRAENPDRLHDMRQRLQAAKARLQMNIEELNRQ